MSVAKAIKMYLFNNGISQTWLSKETKIPLPQLNLSLNEKRKLTITEYEDIIKVLCVPADTFISHDN